MRHACLRESQYPAPQWSDGRRAVGPWAVGPRAVGRQAERWWQPAAWVCGVVAAWSGLAGWAEPARGQDALSKLIVASQPVQAAPVNAGGGEGVRAESQLAIGSLNSTVVQAEMKTVKLYGAGGIAGLEAYQSGFFIDGEGRILTVWSTVLDVDQVIVITSDGRRLEATVAGIDPNLEIAVLETRQPPIDFFPLTDAREAEVGERVLALSNLYGIATGREMSSAQRGVVMAKTRLDARRGSSASVYQGPIYVVDAVTNNPGAAGGALVDLRGQLLGMLGKELRDSRAGVWLNYAIPITELRESVSKILSGQAIAKVDGNRPPADRPYSLLALGVLLVPDVLAKTPAYVDFVQADSSAARAGLQNDDLVLFVNATRIVSQAALRQELNTIDRGDPLTLLVQRGNSLVEIVVPGE
jgi:S1-C subfamily serine protease